MTKLRNIYGNLNKAAFWCTLTLSAVLIIVSFIIPPAGVIDPSVLAATGELFAFAALGSVIAAIDRGGNISLQKGDTTINIDTDDDKKSTEN